MKIRGQEVLDPEVRIQRNSVIDPVTGCWNWQGSNRNGYGSVIVGSRTDNTRRTLGAHRYSFEVFVGPIPDGHKICHRCDNPSCVNPAHLFVGTHDDNMRDMVEKGRSTKGRAVPHERRLAIAATLRAGRYSPEARAAIPPKEG